MRNFFILLLLINCNICLLSISNKTSAQENKKGDVFDNFKKKQDNAFNEFESNTDKQFEEYEKANSEAFEKFKEEVEQLWGVDDFKESSKKNWVEYGSDKKSRTDVDFEKGEATIELLMTPEEAENTQLVDQKIISTIENLATTKGQTKDYVSEVERPEPLSITPILQNQLETNNGEKVTTLNTRSYAKEILAKQPVIKETITGKDNQKRIKVVISLPLAPDNIKIRAEKYLDLINRYSRKYRLQPELIFAIMHTESFFNPKARSHVPAFGLMQLVPRYAGRDAYKFIYKIDKMVSANYLYQPENNIELGTAYLNILTNRYFTKVRDPESRMYCAIAAYNTGAGNVSRAFIGTTKLPNAIPVINSKTPEQIFNHLEKYLPYDETRKYIIRVTERMKKYESWIKND
jgi:membrane-bound lytic murein transglycosylase C